MPLTHAEISRRYREKLKITNPEKYLEMKKKNKSRAIKAYLNKKCLTDAQREERRLKLLQKKNRIRQTVHTIQSTSCEQPTDRKDNTENRSNENNQETQNNLAAQVPNRSDHNEMESRSNNEKIMRVEIIQLREHVQKLMRGYNYLKRDMRKLKSDYRDLAKKVQEKEAETESHAIRRGLRIIVRSEKSELTPLTPSEDPLSLGN